MLSTHSCVIYLVRATAATVMLYQDHISISWFAQAAAMLATAGAEVLAKWMSIVMEFASCFVPPLPAVLLHLHVHCHE
jgi:hypothetical protein